MPRMNEKQEKSKDFKGSMIKLFHSLGKWRKLLLISVILALFSSILSTIAPNRLAGVTDVITEGMKPDTEILSTVIKRIMQNGNLPKEIIIHNQKISIEDQEKLLQVMENRNEESSQEEMIEMIEELPESIQKIIEPKMDLELLKQRAIILAIIYLCSSLAIYIQDIILAYMSNGYSKGLRTDISQKINRLPLKYFDSHETGDILSRVTNDVDSIGMNVNQSIASLVSNLTLFLGSIVMMFVTNSIMAITAILSSILGFVFSFFLLKRSQKYFVERQKELGKLNGHIEEIYSGHNVVKAYNGEKEALEEFDTINNHLYQCNRKSQFLSGIMQPIMGFIGNFGYVAVCVVGSLLVMNHLTTFGTIVAFMIYIRLFTRPLSQIAQSMTALQSTAAAAERVFEFLEEEELTKESHITKKIAKEKALGNIEFQNVTFEYEENHPIIKGFTAKVKSGEKIAIVGPTGAGKTTMVNLLMKFYEIKEGDILIDGISIKELSRENIHNLFCMVLQDTWLFHGSIKENIEYNQKHITEEEIWDACKTVGIDHFIKTLPGGIHSEVADNENISSGQKQLITIARGMIEDAPFLILDEATSNVDTRTEELVQKAMDTLMVGRTSFIIAHRLSTIKNADLILVMNDGNIIEQGTHKELLKKKGFYAKLYQSQFQK